MHTAYCLQLFQHPVRWSRGAAEAEAGGCRLEYFVFLAPGLLISACEHVEKKASSEALI